MAVELNEEEETQVGNTELLILLHEIGLLK